MFQKDYFYTDSLTGIFNLNYMNQFADDWVENLRLCGHTLVLIYIDVISMQFYNSQYGYAEGNVLLRLVADALMAEFPDALIMRGPDDRFIVIDVFENQWDISNRIKCADTAIQKGAKGNTPGIRAGICLYDDHMKTIEAADRARNAIKWLGHDRNKVCHFYTHMSEENYRTQQYILDNFDRALAEGWIKVYYQGIARVETGRAAAFEALARWQDPVRGLLPPGEFIPVLRKYHLVYKLDLYIAEQVCREISIRLKHGLLPQPVTVNFSAQDFDYVDIPTALEEIYSNYSNYYEETDIETGDIAAGDNDSVNPQPCNSEQCDDNRSGAGTYKRYNNIEETAGTVEETRHRKLLIVEITEQDMATATAGFYDQIDKLRAYGFSIWLDDFGSGYSSLNVFSRFDIDLIKFDMDLLKNLDDDRGVNKRILKAMIGVAGELGIHTLAEGMETEEQRDFLRETGCDLAQGYLFHKPEPLEYILKRHWDSW